MASRVAQSLTEIVTSGAPNARVAQAVAEAVVSGVPNARVAQAVVEAILSGKPTTRVSQLAVEIVYLAPNIILQPTFPSSLLGVAFPVARSNMWKTLQQEAISGADYRTALWLTPRFNWTIAFSYLGANAAAQQSSDWQTLLAFFDTVQGSLLPFHYVDPYDSVATDQLIGTGDGSNANFTFQRSITAGGFTSTLPVVDVLAVTDIKVGGTSIGGDYGFQSDPVYGFNYGVVLENAPGAGKAVTATFNYAWPCRFDKDNADFNNLYYGFWELKEIKFTSMKVLI